MQTLSDIRLTVLSLLAIAAAVVAYLLGADPVLGIGVLGVVLYGFHNLEDVLGQRASEVGEETISDAIRDAIAAHNADIAASLALFSRQTTAHSFGVQPAADGELQGLDQWGRPIPRRFPPKVKRELPIFMAGDSIATNYVTQEKMTVQEVNDRVEALTIADARWMRKQLLAAMFTNASYTFNDPEHGNLTISVLANGDTETYLRTATVSGSADTHHKGAAALDQAVLVDMHEEIVEHPENAGEVVVFVPTANKATVQGFAGHVTGADANVVPGSGASQYVGNLGVIAPGTPIGYNEDATVHLREWPQLPANYLVGVSTGGDRALAMREDEEASLRGFHEIPGRDDMPYLQRMWIRRAGFGARNRVGAVVYRTDSATYAAPANLSAPL